MFHLTAFILFASVFGATAAESADWLDYLSRISVVGFLIISHYGFYKGWWVWGPTHNDLAKRYKIRGEKISKLEKEKDAWKEQALTNRRVVERSTSIAQAAIRRAKEMESEGG